jgi:hypothetical protein
MPELNQESSDICEPVDDRPSTAKPSTNVRSREGRLQCIVVADFHALHIGTVARHVGALREFSVHQIQVVHVGLLNFLDFDLSRFDVIVFHYSIVIAQGFHLAAKLRAKLASARGLKILFIQDEYRWIDATAEAIRELEISVLFTVVNRDVVDRIYHHPWLRHVRKELTLTGFVDEALLDVEVPAYEERSVDVAYRARKVPYWLGAFAMEKWTIGRRFEQEADRHDLICDISSDESARMYGTGWIRFLSSAKAVLGTESGASVCDFSGELRARVDKAVDCYKNLGFEAIHDAILKGVDGNIVIHVVSPRMFEAAALRTLMINYPGEYSGCLVPWRHYVPLERDHSNIVEVAAIIKDAERAKKIIEAAYREVACNPRNSFRSFVEQFDQVVAEELDLATVQLSPIVASKRNWRFLEVASWIYFYSSPILVRIRVLAVRVLVTIWVLAVRVVWTVVRMFLPPAWRDRIKQWSRRRWSPRGG